MTIPVPLCCVAALDSEPIVALDTGMGITPLPADHFTAAGNSQNAFLRAGVELCEPPCEVSSRTDKACRRGERISRIVTRNDQAPSEWKLGTVASSNGRLVGDRHVRLGF